MPRVRRLEIVPVGIQRNGQPVDEEILKSVVRNYNDDARPPVTLGHPAKGDDKVAALGRVANLQMGVREKDGKPVLIGEQIYTPELEALEDSGQFEGQSAGIYPVPDKDGEFYLHHLAQLGQLPPAAEIKTQNVVQLSDEGSSESFILSAHMMGSNSENGNEVMKKPQLIEALKALSEDELKEVSTEMGFDVKAPENTNDDNTDDKSKGGNTNDLEESDAVKEMRDTMAHDRREALTELADNANLSDGMKTVVKNMIKTSTSIELCAAGDDSRFNEIKSLIKAQPAQTRSFNPMEEINLSDDKNEQKETFNQEGW